MDIIKIVGIGIVAVIIITIIKQYKPEFAIYVSIIAGIIIAAGMSFIYAYFLSDKISKPIDELTKAAREISEGRYSKRIVIKNNIELQ